MPTQFKEPETAAHSENILSEIFKTLSPPLAPSSSAYPGVSSLGLLHVTNAQDINHILSTSKNEIQGLAQ